MFVYRINGSPIVFGTRTKQPQKPQVRIQLYAKQRPAIGKATITERTEKSFCYSLISLYKLIVINITIIAQRLMDVLIYVTRRLRGIIGFINASY